MSPLPEFCASLSGREGDRKILGVQTCFSVRNLKAVDLLFFKWL